MNRRRFNRHLAWALAGIGSLPACTQKPASLQTQRWQDLETTTAGRPGVAVLDTASGRLDGHRLDERFAMCSTFKWLAAALVLHRVDAGHEQLERRVRFGTEALVPYSPVTSKHAGDGDMTLAGPCDAAITLSDNTAGNLLLQSFDGPTGLTGYARTGRLADTTGPLGARSRPLPMTPPATGPSRRWHAGSPARVDAALRFASARTPPRRSAATTPFHLPMFKLRWLHRRATFRLPRRSSPPPACRLRQLRDTDYPACEAIFLLNEPLHFPPARHGAFEQFKEWLRKQHCLIIVAECDGVVCGLGGISIDYLPADRRSIAMLSFGMVHPAHHGRGIGTALLMCRLSLLPSDRLPMSVCMQSAGASYRFYRKFGFRYYASVPFGTGIMLDCYHVPITRADRVFCECGLAADQVDHRLLIGAKSGSFKALNPADGVVPAPATMPGR